MVLKKVLFLSIDPMLYYNYSFFIELLFILSSDGFMDLS
jgi:hypothetical protein